MVCSTNWFVVCTRWLGGWWWVLGAAGGTRGGSRLKVSQSERGPAVSLGWAGLEVGKIAERDVVQVCYGGVRRAWVHAWVVIRADA
jgi:hypothetical protein